MRVKLVISGYYEVPDDPSLLLEAYETTDVEEVLRIDARTLKQDPWTAVEMLSIDQPIEVTVMSA